MVAVMAANFTLSPLSVADGFLARHLGIGLLLVWAVWTLSTQQDIRRRDSAGVVLSQFIALVALVALLITGITSRSWLNVALATGAVCVQFWLMARWWVARKAQ
ncbi:MAG TPA: hypothetical protein VNK23_00395 [Candidatus Dormibacteraeota bacterium]|nr:hypothetical protein [Candidatus Dormibacteraeota bacterium]